MAIKLFDKYAKHRGERGHRTVRAQDIQTTTLLVNMRGRAYDDVLCIESYGMVVEITGTTLHNIFHTALSEPHNKKFRRLLRKHINSLDGADDCTGEIGDVYCRCAACVSSLWEVTHSTNNKGIEQ